MIIYKNTSLKRVFIEGVGDYPLDYLQAIDEGNGLISITPIDDFSKRVIYKFPFSEFKDLQGSSFNSFQETLDHLSNSIVSDDIPKLWSVVPASIASDSLVDVEVSLSNVYGDVSFKYETGDVNQPEIYFSEDLNNLQRIGPNSYLLKDVPASDVTFLHDLTLSLDSGDILFEDIIDTFVSNWIDMTSGGDSLGRLESRVNMNTADNLQDESNAGVQRDLVGLYNNSNLTTWGHWIKWHDHSFQLGDGVTTSFVVRNIGTNFMVGLFTNPHSETSNQQYYAALNVAYFSNTTLNRLYGGAAGTLGGGNWTFPFTNVSIDPSKYYRIDFTDDGGVGGRFIVYEVGPDRASWDNVDINNALVNVQHNNVRTNLDRVPGAILANNSSARIIGLKVE